MRKYNFEQTNVPDVGEAVGFLILIKLNTTRKCAANLATTRAIFVDRMHDIDLLFTSILHLLVATKRPPK